MLKTIVVHNGLYHADDVLAVLLAKHYKASEDVEIIRTRNPKVLEQYADDYNALVIDVGNGKYDHHDENCKRHEDGHKYCGASLYWEDCIKGEDFVYETLIKPIERLDNGEELDDGMNTSFTRFVKSTIPAWDSEQSLDDAFNACVAELEPFARLLLEPNNVEELKATLDDLASIAEVKETAYKVSIDKGKQLVKDIYAHAEDKRVIRLPKPGMPWEEVLCPSEAKFIVYPTSTGAVNVQCVPPEVGSFEQKIPLPADFITDVELSKFQHAANFLASVTPNDETPADMVEAMLRQKATALCNATELAFVEDIPFSSIRNCESSHELKELLLRFKNM